jgi:dynein heavy chain
MYLENIFASEDIIKQLP